MSDIYADSVDEAKLVELGEATAKEIMEKKMTTTQLRRVFSEIKAMHRDYTRNGKVVPPKLPLIIPKLAYAKARDLMPDVAYRELKSNIEKIKGDGKRFEKFVNFFEVIVAYSRVFEEERKRKGGRGNYNDRN